MNRLQDEYTFTHVHVKFIYYMYSCKYTMLQHYWFNINNNHETYHIVYCLPKLFLIELFSYNVYLIELLVSLQLSPKLLSPVQLVQLLSAIRMS